MEYIKAEPVRFWAAVTAFVVALFPVLNLFNITNLSNDQISALLALLAAVGGVFFAVFVRSKVSPVK